MSEQRRVNIATESPLLTGIVDRLYEQTSAGQKLTHRESDGAVIRVSDDQVVIGGEETLDARREYARERHAGEKFLHEFANSLAQEFFQNDYSISWIMQFVCCTPTVLQQEKPLDNTDYNRFLAMTDLQRMETFAPECPRFHAKELTNMHPTIIRTFLAYEPKKKENRPDLKVCRITSRVKNISLKLSDLITGINKEQGAIPTEINTLHDTYGINIITLKDMPYDALETVRKKLTHLQLKDYIKDKKPNGYQALHEIGIKDGTVVEMHIMDEDMFHNNELGTASHSAWKETKGKERDNHPLWPGVYQAVRAVFEYRFPINPHARAKS